MPLPEPTCLHTARLTLRELRPERWRAVHQTFSEAELIAFFGIQNEKELEEERRRFGEGLAGYRRSFVSFHLIEKATACVIGACGFHTWHLRHARAEIGYSITDESRKWQGFMQEAMPAVIQYGFEEMRLNRIEAFVGPTNTPSLKLVERMGFTQEGIMREHYCRDGQTEDSIVFALLRREWLMSLLDRG